MFLSYFEQFVNNHTLPKTEESPPPTSSQNFLPYRAATHAGKIPETDRIVRMDSTGNSREIQPTLAETIRSEKRSATSAEGATDSIGYKQQENVRKSLAWFVIRNINEPQKFLNPEQVVRTCKLLFDGIERAIYNNEVIRIALTGNTDTKIPIINSAFYSSMGRRSIHRKIDKH